MRGQTPRRIGLEYAVLQHESLRIRPVVRNVARVFVAHNIRAVTAAAARIKCLAAPPAASLLLGDEAIHLAGVDVGHGARRSVWTASVDIVSIVIGLHAAAASWIVDANRKIAVRPPRQPVAARVRAEVFVVRAVLLHDDDDVFDLVYVTRSGRSCIPACSLMAEHDAREQGASHVDEGQGRLPPGESVVELNDQHEHVPFLYYETAGAV